MYMCLDYYSRVWHFYYITRDLFVISGLISESTIALSEETDIICLYCLVLHGNTKYQVFISFNDYPHLPSIVDSDELNAYQTFRMHSSEIPFH